VANLNLSSPIFHLYPQFSVSVSVFLCEQQHVSERNDLQFLSQHVFNRSDRKRKRECRAAERERAATAGLERESRAPTLTTDRSRRTVGLIPGNQWVRLSLKNLFNINN